MTNENISTQKSIRMYEGLEQIINLKNDLSYRINKLSKKESELFDLILKKNTIIDNDRKRQERENHIYIYNRKVKQILNKYNTKIENKLNKLYDHISNDTFSGLPPIQYRVSLDKKTINERKAILNTYMTLKELYKNAINELAEETTNYITKTVKKIEKYDPLFGEKKADKIKPVSSDMKQSYLISDNNHKPIYKYNSIKELTNLKQNFEKHYKNQERKQKITLRDILSSRNTSQNKLLEDMKYVKNYEIDANKIFDKDHNKIEKIINNTQKRIEKIKKSQLKNIKYEIIYNDNEKEKEIALDAYNKISQIYNSAMKKLKKLNSRYNYKVLIKRSRDIFSTNFY